jgi:hypothetical protein
MKIEAVYGMASRICGFRPKPLRVLYSPSIVLAMSMSVMFFLYYTILLWHVGSKELMLDAFLLTILFHLKILELRSIIAPDFLHLELKLIFGSP